MRSDDSEPLLTRLARRAYRQGFVQRWWAGRFRAPPGGDIPWTPLAKPLERCRVALLTTGGVHRRDDTPFDRTDPRGDPSFRVLPAQSASAELTITHDHYDHRDADRDVNVVLPFGPLAALLAERRVGALAPRHYSLMGHIDGPHVATLRERTAPALAQRLRADGADVVVLAPA